MEWIKFTRGFYDALPRVQRAIRQHLVQTQFTPGTAREHRAEKLTYVPQSRSYPQMLPP